MTKRKKRIPDKKELLQEETAAAKILSPIRKSSKAESIEELSHEQLVHFGIDPESDFGKTLFATAKDLYHAQADINCLWRITTESLKGLDRKNRIAYFNAKKFLSFQLAKILDTLQNPFRKTYQSLAFSDTSLYAKGPYPVFDNVTAIFSANPVIVRTATYIYACTEWVDDAFHGREFLLDIYSRLLNPTSISLANFIIDVEAGPHAPEYLAWNFNSGMAAIDNLVSHLLRHNDILVCSRNIYGGTHQLFHDFYASPDRLHIKLEWFDGYTGAEFSKFIKTVEKRNKKRLEKGARILVFLESPCNPMGYVLDLPDICKRAHKKGFLVVVDSTVGTPFLVKPLLRKDVKERPDFVMHSYTKDLTGNGNATAGVIIGENHRMFLPKGETCKGVAWNETLFWGVYYIKGAFLDADKAFEVISGMKTLELRMLQKGINTLVLARFLNSHPDIQVNCNAVPNHANGPLRKKLMRYGLPAPLFTIDFESADIPADAFRRFFDCLAPTLHHQVTLGQSNTVVLCPALTSHSELDEKAQRSAGIYPTTIRIAVGFENPKEIITHIVHTARLMLDPVRPGFSDRFMDMDEWDKIARQTYMENHQHHIEYLINGA